MIESNGRDPFSGKDVQPGHTLTAEQAEKVCGWQKRERDFLKQAEDFRRELAVKMIMGEG